MGLKGAAMPGYLFERRATWNFLTAPGRFDFKGDSANSQGVLNNLAKLTLKGRPLLKRV